MGRQGSKKRLWTTTEDNLLTSAVSKHGVEDWGLVARAVRGRSAKQCRERWKNHLSPGVKKGNWSQEEDTNLVSLVQTMGPQWCAFEKNFPGRSDNMLKNRYFSLVRHNRAPKPKSWVSTQVTPSHTTHIRGDPNPSAAVLRHQQQQRQALHDNLSVSDSTTSSSKDSASESSSAEKSSNKDNCGPKNHPISTTRAVLKLHQQQQQQQQQQGTTSSSAVCHSSTYAPATPKPSTPFPSVLLPSFGELWQGLELHLGRQSV